MMRREIDPVRSTLAAGIYLCIGAMIGCHAEPRGGSQKSSLTIDVCMEGGHCILDYLPLYCLKLTLLVALIVCRPPYFVLSTGIPLSASFPSPTPLIQHQTSSSSMLIFSTSSKPLDLATNQVFPSHRRLFLSLACYPSLSPAAINTGYRIPSNILEWLSVGKYGLNVEIDREKTN